MVAVAEVVAAFACALFNQFGAVNRFGVHSHEGGHAVAAVNVECLSHRTKAMSGVNVAAVVLVVAQTPTQFIVFAVFPIGIPEWGEVVDVGTLHANDFAEHAVLSHVEGGHFKPVVAAVFKNHAVQTVLFAEVDEFPALVEVHSRRHFDGNVLAVFKSAFGNREVVVPVGADVNEVDVGTFAHLNVAIFATVDFGFGHSLLGEVFLARFGTFFFVVAQCHCLSAGNIGEAFNGAGTAHAKSGKAYAHHFELWCGEVNNVLLTFGTNRGVGYDGVAAPVPTGVA